ncbi:hypothetical protein HMPREF0973_00286 [Prevotella veroralis F0319]|uniref:Uncharacterized protein n=1 Tax=Prevotella veroralis F0319 TaxID=649761 RepID=C9ML11_9BACT|nr:hypothetical protein HMPREF0973_00286 [Prevotella veroralis F0319]
MQHIRLERKHFVFIDNLLIFYTYLCTRANKKDTILSITEY